MIVKTLVAQTRMPRYGYTKDANKHSPYTPVGYLSSNGNDQQSTNDEMSQSK